MRHHLIHRYIFKEIAYPFFLVLLILTFVLLMGRILQLMDLMVNKGVGFHIIAQLILYLVPSFLVITIPMALLISILISMERLSRENEILVIKSAGLSLYHIVPPVALAAVAAFIVSFIMGVCVVPAGNSYGRALLMEMARQKAGIGVKEKIFNDAFPGLLLYADQVSVDGSTMKGIFLSDNRLGRNPVTIIAERGKIVADSRSAGIMLRLEEGSTHMVDGELKTYRKMDFSVYDIVLDMSSSLSSGADSDRDDRRDVSGMTMRELLQDLRRPDLSQTEHNVLLLEFNKRFAIPVTCLIFALLALPLGMVRHRTAKSRGFVVGLCIVIIYYTLQLAGDALGETGKFHPVAAAWIPNALLGIAGFWLFKRAAAEKPLLNVDPIVSKIRTNLIRRIFRSAAE